MQTGWDPDPSIATIGRAGHVIVWSSTSSEEILGRRLRHSPAIDVDGDGHYASLEDGMLILRYTAGVRGAALIAGVVAPGCTRCDAVSIEAYLGSLF